MVDSVDSCVGNRDAGAQRRRCRLLTARERPIDHFRVVVAEPCGSARGFAQQILGAVGVPPAGIGLILGVDRFLDMCRTTLNVIGDLVAATVISARNEKTA